MFSIRNRVMRLCDTAKVTMIENSEMNSATKPTGVGLLNKAPCLMFSIFWR